jgi:CheY-like chemotaxis protein
MSNLKNVVFYADDDSDDLDYFVEAAQDVNDRVTVITHQSGFHLLDALKNPPPEASIIFLDLNMPGKDGFQVLSEIRRDEKYNHIPVVIFTTSNDDTAIAKSKQLGANYYVVKPTTFLALKKIIDHVFTLNFINGQPFEKFVYSVN